jgi:23S rRNA (uridine2552-2'-O)-methyltransferase
LSGRTNSKKIASGARRLKQNVKTAKGRKIASTRWLSRHINDPFVIQSKQDHYRSRAAYKLLAIDDKFNLLKRCRCVIDLGAAPGGWSQVVRRRAPNATIIAIDLQEIEPIDGIVCMQADFLSEDTILQLQETFKGNTPDLILSDMASKSCGDKGLDHLRIMNLVQEAWKFAARNLAVGGSFVAKILQGGNEKDLMLELRKYFNEVKFFKPEASYSDSSEIYLIARQLIKSID